MAHLEPELLSAYIDHELPAADVAAVERHLAECDACRREYEELRALSTLVSELPVYLPKRAVDVRAYPRGGSDTVAKIIAFSRPIAIAAVILLIAFAGLRLISQMNDDSTGDNQISFSAVQPTPVGTESAGGASEEQAAARSAQEAPPPMSAVQSQPTEAPGEAPAADAAQDAEAPMAAAPSRSTEAPAVTATVAPEPVARDANGRSWLPEAVVAVVVVLIAGAAGWYKLARSPGRRRA